ncbi:hypothetical protein [Streptomyces sp. NPDC001056]
MRTVAHGYLSGGQSAFPHRVTGPALAHPGTGPTPAPGTDRTGRTRGA